MPGALPHTACQLQRTALRSYVPGRLGRRNAGPVTRTLPATGGIAFINHRRVLSRAHDPSSTGDPAPAAEQLSSAGRELLRRYFRAAAAGQLAGSGGGTGMPAPSSGAGQAAAAGAVPVEILAADPHPGAEPEDLQGPSEPLAASKGKGKSKGGKKQQQTAAEQQAAAAAATASEVVFTAEQLAAGAVSDAADVAAAAADVAASAAAGVASDAADVAGAAQAAVEAVAQQSAEAAGAAAQAAADMAAAITGGMAGASRPGSQLPAPEQPAGSLPAAPQPSGALSAPAPPSGELSAPAPPAGSLPAPEQPAGALAAPAAAASSSSSSSSGSDSTSSSHGPPSAAEDRADEVAALKAQLVGLLASLDRGAAATEDQVQRVDNLARRLEVLGGAVTLSWQPAPGSVSKPTMAQLDGRWRLLYSSGFASGSLGGRRPGPSFGSLPTTLGPVYQDIDTDASTLDNVVELFLRFSLASLPGINAAVPTAVARLRHTFQIIGANTVEITFEDTEVKLSGGLQNWLDRLPMVAVPKLPDWLQPDKRLRSARFDVVFLDNQMRITRGDRGELRVFLKGAA